MAINEKAVQEYFKGLDGRVNQAAQDTVQNPFVGQTQTIRSYFKDSPVYPTSYSQAVSAANEILSACGYNQRGIDTLKERVSSDAFLCIALWYAKNYKQLQLPLPIQKA